MGPQLCQSAAESPGADHFISLSLSFLFSKDVSNSSLPEFWKILKQNSTLSAFLARLDVHSFPFSQNEWPWADQVHGTFQGKVLP